MLISKVVRKIKKDGPHGLFVAAVRQVGRLIKKKKFKFMGTLFLKKEFGKKKQDHFQLMGVDLVKPEAFPASVIFSQIKSAHFFILSSEKINFSNESRADKLIWNMDLVENVEWSKDKWGVDLIINLNRGDIKRPWEIGRLHHLVQLALCYQSFESADDGKAAFDLAGAMLKDFSNSNPGFLGPQWMCAMDAGIRIANICLASELFGSQFAILHGDLLAYEVKRHKFFIENNLENQSGQAVSNHYLGDLVGLIFCSAYQKRTALRERKLRSLYSELLSQMNNQFLSDGGNFENSTYYHRLSSELLVFGLAISQSCLSRTEASLANLSEDHVTKINSILHFSKAITDYQNFVLQIGDTDSGHLFIFDPVRFEQNDLNHLELIAGISSFIECQRALENSFSSVLNAFINFKSQPVLPLRTSDFSEFGQKSIFLKMLKDISLRKNTQHYEFPIPAGSLSREQFYAFPEFGLFLINSPQAFFSVRSGVNSRDFLSGHRHVDQLSITLKSDLTTLARDPGSYLYTSNTMLRNKFRSAELHNVPFLYSDGNPDSESIFELKGFDGKCYYFGDAGFLGSYQGNLDRYYRLIQFLGNRIIVDDWSEKEQPISRLSFKESLFSPHYGKLQKL